MRRPKITVLRRDTKQRRAILTVLRNARGPLAPREICRRAQRLTPGLGLATVYRNLRKLSESGILRAVELPTVGRRFELASVPHHHHFVCRLCDRAYCTRSCTQKLADWVPPGFVVESHEITLFGICRDCSNS